MNTLQVIADAAAQTGAFVVSTASTAVSLVNKNAGLLTTSATVASALFAARSAEANRQAVVMMREQTLSAGRPALQLWPSAAIADLKLSDQVFDITTAGQTPVTLRLENAGRGVCCDVRLSMELEIPPRNLRRLADRFASGQPLTLGEIDGQTLSAVSAPGWLYLGLETPGLGFSSCPTSWRTSETSMSHWPSLLVGQTIEAPIAVPLLRAWYFASAAGAEPVLQVSAVYASADNETLAVRRTLVMDPAPAIEGGGVLTAGITILDPAQAGQKPVGQASVSQATRRAYMRALQGVLKPGRAWSRRPSPPARRDAA